MLQISVQEVKNDLMLPIFQVGFFVPRNVDRKVYIGDTSLRKYMPKYIKPKSNRNSIKCVCETCISAMLLQSDMNKWSLSQLAKLDKLYINYASTRFSQISKIGFIGYTGQKFPNNSHIHLRAFGAESSYHYPSPITGQNITK